MLVVLVIQIGEPRRNRGYCSATGSKRKSPPDLVILNSSRLRQILVQPYKILLQG